MNRCRAVGAIATLIASAGCDGAGAPLPSVVRDSAGVRIVENAAPRWTAETAWRLGTEPLLDIGGGDTDEQQLFRVVGALRLSDGRIVVANAGTHQLRFYDGEGQHIGSAGGEGEGPGEFRRIAWVQRLAEDSLAAYDLFQRRLSVFDAQGQFKRSVRLGASEARVGQAVGVLADGRILARRSVGSGPPPNGRFRAPANLLLYGADGSFTDSVGIEAGSEMFIHQIGPGFMASPYPFGRTANTVIHGTQFLTGATDSYEIRAFAANGRLATIVRRRVAARTVREDDLTAELDRILNLFTEADLRRQIERALRDTPVSETMPAFGPAGWLPLDIGFRVDALGNLWVREYPAGERPEPEWTVFDSTGVLLGMLSMPTGVTLIDIGSDYVLGVWRDEDDVEHVMMYGLAKPDQ